MTYEIQQGTSKQMNLDLNRKEQTVKKEGKAQDTTTKVMKADMLGLACLAKQMWEAIWLEQVTSEVITQVICFFQVTWGTVNENDGRVAKPKYLCMSTLYLAENLLKVWRLSENFPLGTQLVIL